MANIVINMAVLCFLAKSGKIFLLNFLNLTSFPDTPLDTIIPAHFILAMKPNISLFMQRGSEYNYEICK